MVCLALACKDDSMTFMGYSSVSGFNYAAATNDMSLALKLRVLGSIHFFVLGN